ncbi:MAG: coproporphyrinogen III oxidase family protein [Puniceicoccales bacterium]|jgi:oxygen-independent coproporphyrinogen-3 oxidase|nr:coproporphyrinogen III oxidase family protein [Puniceicoccales bacterium]
MTSDFCGSSIDHYGLGIYVHVPFCASRCAYCTFYGEPPRRGDMDHYLNCLAMEWKLRWDGRPAGTIYFGGGTPGLLSCSDFEKIAEFLGPALSPQLREWTVEFSPATVRQEKLRTLKKLGVTRISLGVQSFDDRRLAALGRRQRAELAITAFDLIRTQGFAISLDLIFLVPGQRTADWKQDLARAVDLGPDHISTYCLTAESDAPIWKNRSVPPSTAGEVFHRSARNFLQINGYEHYEVSNFCRPDHRCLHNCNTWAMGEWLGLGPAAASQFRGRRFRNVPDLQRWTAGIWSGSPAEEDVAILSEQLLLQDRFVFGMRTADGVPDSLLEQATKLGHGNLRALFERFTKEGLVRRVGDRLCPTGRGLLLADGLALEILCHCA